MGQIASMAEIASFTASMIQRDDEIASETKEAKVNEIIQRSVAATLQVELTEANIQVTKEEARKIANDILIGWGELTNEQQKTRLQERLIKFNTSQSQRTFDNILKGVNSVFNVFKRNQ